MRKLALIPLLALLATCTDDGTVTPLAPDGPEFAKGGVPGKPGGGGGGGEGEADGEYTITDLGTLPGNTSSMGSGINVNDVGVIQVVGSSWGPEDGFDVPTLWTADGGVTVTALQMPDGAKHAAPLAITKTGVAVGASGVGPVYWHADGSAQLLPLGEGANEGQSWANDVSLVDGSVLIVGSQRTSPTQAVYWVNGLLQSPLPALEPGAHASAKAVNSQGTIAGYSTGHAVVWHRDTQGDYRVCDLGLSSIAFGISEPTTDGRVHVAGAFPTTDYFATVWTVDLDATQWEQPAELCAVTTVRSLDFFSEFRDVNAQGDAVGEDFKKHKAILWTGGVSNALVYLPSLTNKGFSGANAINADGSSIAGKSAAKKSTRAVLWTRKD